MRVQTLTESKAEVIELSDDQAAALVKAGQRLASDKSWWGSELEDEQDSDRLERNVIDCSHVSDRRWRVRVRDAVGLIVVGDTQIEVQPKIPQQHLLYLLEKAGYLPRLGDERALAARDTPLWKLVARWFLSESERVLRRDLMRGYQNRADDLKLIRGRLDALATGRAYYAGRLAFACEFDEFTTDIALNRVVRAAARVVAGSTLLDWDDRKRGLAVLARMEEVSDLQAGDLRARVGRTTAHYNDALALARHILQGHGRLIRTGEHTAWTFLIRTPEAVEAGTLASLQEHLSPRWSVTKQGRRVDGAPMTFNPDLVFNDGLAVGDVKYKRSDGSWRRNDLYQLISFATIYETHHGIVVGFKGEGSENPPAISVGKVHVRYLGYDAHPEISAVEAAATLASDVSAWLDTLTPARHAAVV